MLKKLYYAKTSKKSQTLIFKTKDQNITYLKLRERVRQPSKLEL